MELQWFNAFIVQRHDLDKALLLHRPFHQSGSIRTCACACEAVPAAMSTPPRTRCVTTDAAKQVTTLCSDELATDAVPAFDHVPSPPLSRPAEPTPPSSPPRVRQCYIDGPMGTPPACTPTRPWCREPSRSEWASMINIPHAMSPVHAEAHVSRPHLPVSIRVSVDCHMIFWSMRRH